MAHSHDPQEVLDELAPEVAALRERIPEVFRGFGRLHGAVYTDGALPATTKELIALAISVVKGCDGCIAHHARALARRGADPDEVAEALGVAIAMDGGPGTVHAPRAFAAFTEPGAGR